MTTRPRLVRSIPFWLLIVGSIATSALGAWITTDKLGVMTSTLAAGTATGVEVYVGQVWAIIGGILVATGLIGLALALVTAAARSLIPTPVAEVVVVEPVDWTDEEIDEVEASDLVAESETDAAAGAESPADLDTTSAVEEAPVFTNDPAPADR